MNFLSIKNWINDNGVPVYFVENHEIPMVTISVDVAAGSAYDDDKLGMSNLTNLMLSQGSKSLDANQLMDNFEINGARFYVTSDREMATIGLLSLSDKKYLKRSLQLFTQVLGEPIFPEKHFLRLQNLVLNAITQQSSMPESIAKNAFYSALYQDHPYGHSVLGTMQSVSMLTIEDVKKFYHSNYTTKNTSILLAGDLTKTQAELISNQIGNSLVRGKAAKVLPKAASLKVSAEHRILFPSEQTHIMIGQVGIQYNDPFYFPILLGNQILGGNPVTSRLFKEIRDKEGLVYNVVSSITSFRANGPFSIILQTENKKAKKALKMVQELLDLFITNGPTKHELEFARNNLIDSLPFIAARNDTVIDFLRKIAFYGLSNDYLDKYRTMINEVTTKQIQRAFQRFNPDTLATIMVGNFK